VSSWSFPPAAPYPRCSSSLHGVPRVGSPASSVLLEHSDSGLPFPLRFVAFAQRYRGGVPRFAPTGGRTPDAREPGPLLPVALPALCRGDNGVSQVPGRTLARLPSLLRPRGNLGAWPDTALRCSLRLLDGVRPSQSDVFRGSITRPSRSLFTLRSAGRPAPRKTRYRLVASLCRAGLSPAGFAIEGFRSGYVIRPPSPSFTWRNQNSVARLTGQP